MGKLTALNMLKQAYTQQIFPQGGESVPKLRFSGSDNLWQQHRLSDICKTYSGRTPKVGHEGYYSDRGRGGGIPFIRSSEIHSDKTELFLTQEGFEKSWTKMVDIGTILYALYGATSGEAAHSKMRGAINQAILAIEPKKGYNSEYILQWLKGHKNNITSSYLQGGQGNLSASIIRALIILAPSLPEQAAIGAFFRNLDEQISVAAQKLERLKQLREAYLQQIFPDEKNTPHIRFAGFNKAWQECRLGEVGSAFAGLSQKTKGDFGCGDAEFVTYLNVFSNAIANTKQTEHIGLDSKQNELQYGDVLLTISSETPQEIGMASAWLDSRENVYLNSFCLCYRAQSILDPCFLAFLLRSPKMRRKFALLAQGISRYNISRAKVLDIPILFPEKEEQIAIGSFFYNMDKYIELWS